MTTQLRATLLDEVMPVYEFADVQSTVVRATPQAIFGALREVTFGEIGPMRPLFWLRALPERFGRGQPDETSAEAFPGPDAVFLDVALGPESPWILLAEAAEQEVVIGAVGAFAQPRLEFADIRTPADFAGPIDERHVRTAMGVRVVPGGSAVEGYTLTIESRTHVPASTARTRFRWYWRAIRPFEALMARQALAAVRRRAEAAAVST